MSRARTFQLSACLWALSILLAGPASAGDWPQFQGPQRDGTSVETGLLRSWPEGGPQVLWTVELGPGFGGAAVVGGEVFLYDRVSGDEDVLRCLDLDSGKELWRYADPIPGRLSYDGSRCVPTVVGNHVYTIGGFGQVWCIDRQEQDLLWSVELADEYDTDPPRWGWAQSPLILDDLLFVSPLSDDVGVVALDRETGEGVWRTEGLGTSHSTPTLLELNGITQLLMITVGQTTSFDPKTGKELWSTDALDCRIPITIPTRIDDERVFLTAGYGAGSAMVRVRKNGKSFRAQTLWESRRGSQVHPPMRAGDHLYLLANENDNHAPRRREQGGLLCVDLDGEEQWRTGADPFFGRGNMIMADGMLIVQDGFNGALHLIEPSPDGFQPIAEANLFGIEDTKDHQLWGPMALSNGRLLMRGVEELKCVDLRGRKTKG